MRTRHPFLKTKHSLYIAAPSIYIAVLGIVLATMLMGCGPKKPTVAELRAEKHVQDSLALIAEQRSLNYYDSLLQQTLPLVDPMLKNFKYEKRDQYESHGHYVHRLHKTENNTQRCYLQTYISDDWKVSVKAYYYGSKSLKINKLQLSADSLTNTFSGSGHSFDAEGHHEILTLSDEASWSLLQFVNGLAFSRTLVTYIGEGGQYKFYLQDNDRQAILETCQLASTMRDIHELEKRIRQASLQIEKYQKRLQK